MKGVSVPELDAAGHAAAGTERDLLVALEMEGGGLERLVEIEALRRDPGNVYE